MKKGTAGQYTFCVIEVILLGKKHTYAYFSLRWLWMLRRASITHRKKTHVFLYLLRLALNARASRRHRNENTHECVFRASIRLIMESKAQELFVGIRLDGR